MRPARPRGTGTGGIHAEYTEREVRKAAQRTVRAYRSALTTMLERNPYERFYMHSNINFARSLLSAEAQKVLHHAIKTARKRTGQRAVRRTTQMDDGGRLRFIERPPAMTTAPVQNTDVVPRLFAEYRRTVSLGHLQNDERDYYVRHDRQVRTLTTRSCPIRPGSSCAGLCLVHGVCRQQRTERSGTCWVRIGAG